MRKTFFLFCPFVLAGAVFIFSNSPEENVSATALEQYKMANAIGCAPLSDEPMPDASGKYIGVLPGWGAHSYKISTSSDSAQVYFNQGLTMYYSYHWREAVASFREAARFDSTNAMLYWGQALALGPTYNFGHLYKKSAALPAILEKMHRYLPNATPKEQMLMRAMTQRYNASDPEDKDRQKLNAAYAVAMQTVALQFPEDLDIQALYIDAEMLIHPWDFWFNDGQPKEWTTALVQRCEKILAGNPQHPAALHYYIHLTEASRRPEVALASADSLIQLFPGVAHMVHMSSHEYERIGYYAKGVLANEKADSSLVLYDSLAKGLFPQVHVPHYFTVDAYCALSGAMYKRAMEKSLACRNSVTPTKDATYPQYQFMFPQLAMVRLGKWQQLLNDTTYVDPAWSYAALLDHFAKGMAYSKTGNQQAAMNQLQQLRSRMQDKILEDRFAPYTSSPVEVAAVAENILLGTIYFKQKKYEQSLEALRKAIRAEDGLIYSEPKVWILPARQYLGAALMQLNRAAEAEKVYRDDLVWNPGNGWSLLGLYQALKAQGKTKELAAIEKKYRYSFSEADEMPTTSAY